MMNTSPVSYYVGCLSVTTILAILGSTSEARSLLEQAVHKTSHDIVKRNTWWSKKSMDEANRIGLDSARSTHDNQCDSIKETLGCYTEGCVPEFVWCTQQSGEAITSDAHFLHCQLRHKICVAQCLADSSKTTFDDLLS